MLGDPYFAGLGYASLYALIGLVLAGLALAAYRRRHLESAGDVVSVRWVRPVFKYGVAFCTAVTLSTVFYYVLDPLLPRGSWTLLVLMVVWGAAGLLCGRDAAVQELLGIPGRVEGLRGLSVLPDGRHVRDGVRYNRL
ncbi:MAG: hypothetical protein ACLRNQ_18425 [Flavonifractor plautii]